MKKWNKLTAVFAGIAVCLSLIGSPTGVQAQADNNTAKASQPAVRTGQQTEESAELSVSNARKLDTDKIGETTSYNGVFAGEEWNLFCPYGRR